LKGEAGDPGPMVSSVAVFYLQFFILFLLQNVFIIVAKVLQCV